MPFTRKNNGLEFSDDPLVAEFLALDLYNDICLNTVMPEQWGFFICHVPANSIPPSPRKC